MLRFELKRYPCSSMKENSCLPSLSFEREKYEAKSTINDYEGLFIGYGHRETSYPYTEQNNYEEEIEQDVNVAILENEWMYAEFLPDFGGRLWKLYDKKQKKDVLYTNDVIRLRNLSIRNAWFSGGVEWNCGIIGHTPFTCSRMYCAMVQGKGGEEVLRFYEFERVRGIYYQMDFWLDGNKLMAAVRIENPGREVVPMYWWSNMATPEYEGGRVAVPADSAYNNSDGMGIKKSCIPFDQGIDVSYPKNIPDTIDYFYDIPERANKFIANVDQNGYGLLQFSSNRLKGRKLFSWGHRKGSAHWQQMLTDKAGDYVEIQAGLGKTQYECIPMPPKTSWSFLECYTLANIGAQAVAGTYDAMVAAVNNQVDGLFSSTEMDVMCKAAEKTVALQKGDIVFAGSGFGYLENCLTGNKPGHLEFEPGEDTTAWQGLLETGYFTEGETTFACGAAMEQLLENKLELCDWRVSYQLGLLCFDKKEFEKAKALCEKSMVLDNNYLNNHLYAFILYHLKEDRFSYFALRCLEQNKNSYAVCETILKLLLQGESYQNVIEGFETIGDVLKERPRLNLYLSMAYLHLGDADKAEAILLRNGGLKLLDFREGDKTLDWLYRGIRAKKYDEQPADVIVPEQFDFIVAKQVKTDA